MMKARQYDRRFFSRGIQLHVYAIVESNHVDKFAVDYFCNGDAKLTAAMNIIIKELHDAKEYGSILTVSPQDWSALYDRFAEITEDINMSRETALRELLPLVQVAEALAQKYDVVVTNPPYMGSSGMSAKLSDYVKKNYPDSKSDLFSCFIEHGNGIIKRNRFNCMITMQSWMFLSSFEKMRAKALQTKTITNLMHMENMVMGIAFGTAVTIFRNNAVKGYKGTYNQIKLQDIENDTPKQFPIQGNRFAQVSTDNFSKIPGSPVAYWVSKAVLDVYSRAKLLGNIASPRTGMTTGDNNRFLRLWFEIEIPKAKFDAKDADDARTSGKKWFPYCKGGGYMRWYGYNEYLVNWENDGFEIKNNIKPNGLKAASVRSESLYFKKLITWSAVTSGSFSCRLCEGGSLFDSGGSSIDVHGETLYILAILNSVIGQFYLDISNATINYQPGDIAGIPVVFPEGNEPTQRIEECVDIARKDWDSFETSWDFQHHPLLRKVPTIAEAFTQWQTECDGRFNQLQANEEELNRIFIDIYGLQDELTPEVEDKDVTVRKADLGRDIRSFISYAVGCMFGRYSLDEDGLVYAGGEWDASKYVSFAADKDNIIPICDDEYFEDDIVGLFVEFVKTVYGADVLDENLKFIADALGGKGQPKEVIRNYFLNDFYKDHCKIYQKRPIYWLFDSGKKNGFKALIYMHRYQPDTIARIRTDYVHEQQARYRTAIADLEQRIANASAGERVKLNKKLTTLQAQDTEIRTYEEKIHHLADQMISIDLDDGVKKNYAIFQDVLAKIK